jgi:hypothetical protein
VIATPDLLAWGVLLALIDECPALHAGVGASQDSRTLSDIATDFEFISENIQIASVREFMRSLPETLIPDECAHLGAKRSDDVRRLQVWLRYMNGFDGVRRLSSKLV